MKVEFFHVIELVSPDTYRADAVTAHTEGGVVDPVPVLQLEEPGVTAGHPVVSSPPVSMTVHLTTGLAIHSPPVPLHQAVVLHHTTYTQPDSAGGKQGKFIYQEATFLNGLKWKLGLARTDSMANSRIRPKKSYLKYPVRNDEVVQTGYYK